MSKRTVLTTLQISNYENEYKKWFPTFKHPSAAIMMPRMGPPAAARQDNPLHVSFRNPQWPPNFINKDNVLDYFCNQANAFYEMNSCNQQIRMQNIVNRTVEECLRTMPGIQYVLWYSQPPLFIICKQRRNNVTNGKSYKNWINLPALNKVR